MPDTGDLPEMRFGGGWDTHRTRGGETAPGTGQQAMNTGGLPPMAGEQTPGVCAEDTEGSRMFLLLMH